jgi:hypothetical protein
VGVPEPSGEHRRGDPTEESGEAGMPLICRESGVSGRVGFLGGPPSLDTPTASEAPAPFESEEAPPPPCRTGFCPMAWTWRE